MEIDPEEISARMAVHHVVLRCLLQANPQVEQKLRANRELFETEMLFFATSDGWHDKFELAWAEMLPDQPPESGQAPD